MEVWGEYFKGLLEGVENRVVRKQKGVVERGTERKG